MKQQKILKAFLTLTIAFTGCTTAHAKTPSHSIRSSILDNPYMVLADDPKNNLLHGFVAALRTAPGRTDECKFFFRGEPFKNGTARISIADAARYRAPSSPAGSDVVHGVITTVGKKYVLEISNPEKIGDCDWILGFIGGPSVLQKGTSFQLTFLGEESGDWNSLAVICRKRAHFYSAPAEQKKRKAFVVAGDFVYVFDEIGDWYYAKFSDGRSETVGWIRKADTVQLQGDKILSACN